MDNLEKYRDENAFQVPNGYFEKMQDEVFQKIHYHQKISHRNKFIITFSSLAASILIFIGLLVFLPKNGQPVLVSSLDSVSESNVFQQVNSELNTNQEVVSEDESKLSDNNEQIAASGSVNSKTKNNSKRKVQQYNNLDYDIVESYSEELVYADIAELYSE